MVGEQLLEGKGTPRHPIEAARWYSRAAEAGHVSAQSRLCRLHLFGIPETLVKLNSGLFEPVSTGEPDFYAALPWARMAADAGSADAQAMLGYILSYGPEDLRDLDAAFGWYRASAQQNCPQGRLGYAIALLARGDSPESIVVAREELLRAAECGLPTAHYLLGISDEEAIGTSRDDASGAAPP